MANEGFGYKGPANEDREVRSYHLSDGEWVHLFCVIYLVAAQGGAASVYTSRDRSALCVAIKADKARQAYWIGPDDSATDVLLRIAREWNIRGDVEPLGEHLK